MIKIVQLQYSTESGGRSALRLQHAFLDAGISSKIISLQRDTHPLENIVYLGKRRRYIAKIFTRLQTYLIRNRVNMYGMFSFLQSGSNISGLKELKEADYIYIHWVQNGFLNPHNIGQLASLGKPVIVVMHDMWSMTGGCHYSFDCTGYLKDCKNCPVFLTKKEQKYAEKKFRKKNKVYSAHDNFYFVSPSKWLYNCAKQSVLLRNKPVFYIPNILDTELFKPIDKKEAKNILDIPAGTTVIAFGAVSIESYRKGWIYLNKALMILKEDKRFINTIILIFGSDYNEVIAEAIPFTTKFLGYLGDEYSTALAYNAADVFVVPSLADNQPTTVQESLACGTPVVGFNVGGIPDMILHKQNGYLAKYKDEEDLAAGIRYCLDNNIEAKILENFNISVTMKKHYDLYDYIKQEHKG